MKDDPLEQIAQNLWEKLGLPWNKIEAPTHYGINSWSASARLPNGTLECKEYPEPGEVDPYEGPVELRYGEENKIILGVKSSYAVGYKEHKGKGALEYAIPSTRYAELVERVKRAGPIGERLIQQQRRGNPEIAQGASWTLPLDSFEGLEDFFYNFMK